MCDCLELFSFCSFAILDVKIFELCDKGAYFPTEQQWDFRKLCLLCRKEMLKMKG